MIRHSKIIFVICLLLILGVAVQAMSQPQAVPKLSERPLDKASYVKLAKEWKAYIDKHGETSDALVNLGMAYDYSGQLDAAVFAGRRAVILDHDNPKALAFMAKMLAVYKEDEKEALKLLKHCMEVAPDYEDGLIMLTAIYLRRGELEKSEEVSKTIFEQRTISQPLQDYAYNMLVGLPKGAVLITNGDNDTFPPLALQAGMDFRKDVAVINRSLLNLKTYCEGIFKRYPSIKPEGTLEPEKNQILSNTIIKRMVEEQKVPIYFAASVPLHQVYGGPGETKPELVSKAVIEGLNRRTSRKGLTDEESARLFLEKYRLDSATDWNFPWDLKPSLSGLMKNYAACMIKIAEQDDVHPETRLRLLDKAMDIASFHHMSEAQHTIRSLQEKWKAD